MKQFLLLFFTLFALHLSYGQSFNEVKQSAEQGDANAQFDLGVMYDNGEGTLMDKKQAAYWIKQAYENGSSEAKDAWEEYELWKY
jgi:TPR repeat protein